MLIYESETFARGLKYKRLLEEKDHRGEGSLIERIRNNFTMTYQSLVKANISLRYVASFYVRKHEYLL